MPASYGKSSIFNGIFRVSASLSPFYIFHSLAGAGVSHVLLYLISGMRSTRAPASPGAARPDEIQHRVK
ncbi:hypothetical protein [Daejeonella sp.]|uniref:hypothetical protein n=1 Tax=Daejeonella sp. TaxID=2805397 RepID=UPI002727A9B4|nr:hypothetical protein [Daejeonella sp.]MDO8993277.1 hypothetical protein [Daejeonella sp.]MDP2413442.1 hypothetical protein [Daejeonella sp.]